MSTRRHFLLSAAAGAVLLRNSARAQMMAHPGWRGNGIGNAVWWRDAVFVREAEGTPLETVASHLDRFTAAGADAVVLPPLSAGADLTAIDASLGSNEQLDALLREASGRRMHVLVSLPIDRLIAAPNAGDAVVRSWLARGVAGLDLGTLEPGDAAGLAAARRFRTLADRSLGQRVLLARGDAPAAGADPVTLRVVAANAAAKTRAPHAVEVAAAGTQREDELSAAGLLLQAGPPLLSAATLLRQTDGDSWLARVLALRRTQPALRRGDLVQLETDVPGTFATVARAAVPVVVVGNGTDASVTLNLQPQLQSLHLRGYFLRALLRNDGGMGPVPLSRLTLPAQGVVVGELHF